MNEFQFAKILETQYSVAKSEFEKPNITYDLLNLKADKLDYKKLKSEVENLGYHLELAENINIDYWQEQSKIAPYFVFFKTIEDL